MSNVKNSNNPYNFDNVCRAFDFIDGEKQTQLKEAIAEEISIHVHQKSRSYGIHRDEITKKTLMCNVNFVN